MNMVLLIYTFIRATCDGLWELHLLSLNILCQYLFAYDKQKYVRLVPLYLAEIATFQGTDPDIHHDLSPAVWTRQGENIARLKSVVRSPIIL